MSKLKPIRHGEIMLVPVSKLPKNGKTTSHTNYIIGHSKTGHHHVLEAEKGQDFDIMVSGDDIYINVKTKAQIVHKKATDRHKTLEIKKGIYRRFHDTEYNPFERLIEAVRG